MFRCTFNHFQAHLDIEITFILENCLDLLFLNKYSSLILSNSLQILAIHNIKNNA